MWLLTAIHVFLCLFLLVIVLVQSGKGAEIGAVFGGSSQTVFGSQGAATFLSKVTAICAVGFMVTSLALVYYKSKESSTSVVDQPRNESPTPMAGAAGQDEEDMEDQEPLEDDMAIVEEPVNEEVVEDEMVEEQPVEEADQNADYGDQEPAADTEEPQE